MEKNNKNVIEVDGKKFDLDSREGVRDLFEYTGIPSEIAERAATSYRLKQVRKKMNGKEI